jgi:hypothetical protein
MLFIYSINAELAKSPSEALSEARLLSLSAMGFEAIEVFKY